MKHPGLILSIFVMMVTNASLAAAPSHLVIDPSDQHATTFVGIPPSLAAKDLQKIKDGLAQRKGAYLLSWSDFKSNPHKHVKQYIRRNDYPEVDVVAGLSQLVERYSGKPFGLTWNGGLAVTNNDYRHAARTYSAHLSNPDATVRRDRKSDPVHPANHLEVLLTK